LYFPATIAATENKLYYFYYYRYDFSPATSRRQMFLGEFDEMHFDSAAMRAAVAAFQEDLRRVQRAIIQRNDGLDVPYTYLMPDSIPKTISA